MSLPLHFTCNEDVFTQHTKNNKFKNRKLLRVRCFKVVGSLLSKQNTGMSENTTRIFIPHESSNSTQGSTTSSTRLVNTLDLPSLYGLCQTHVTSLLQTRPSSILTRDLCHTSVNTTDSQNTPGKKPSKNYTDSLIYFTAKDSRTFRLY